MHRYLINNINFLPVILLIGFNTTYQDFKSSRIRNEWVAIGLVYSCVIYLFIWIFYALGSPKFYLLWNFDKWCVNLAVSVIVAYILWRYKMWGAGDAKLFICFSALIPIGQYSKVYFNYYFASFSLLVLIFIPASLYLVFRSAAYFLRRFDSEAVRNKAFDVVKGSLSLANLFSVGKVLFGFFVFFLFFYVLRVEFAKFSGKFFSNQNLLMAVSLLIFNRLARVFKNNSRTMLAVFILLVLYMIYRGDGFLLGILKTIKSSITVMVIFPVLKKIADLYAERTTQKTMPFAMWVFLGVLLTWFL